MSSSHTAYGQAMLSPPAGRPNPGSANRRYLAASGPAEPVELFGQIADAGIRLRCGDGELLAEVPQATIADCSWPALDRRLSRYAGSLAMTVTLAHRFGAGRPPHRVAAKLADLRTEVPEVLLDTVGGADRLAKLIAGLRADAEFDLEFDLGCVACCRGLAVRAIRRGRSLRGVLVDEEGDDENREPQAAAAAGRRTGVRERGASGDSEDHR